MSTDTGMKPLHAPQRRGNTHLDRVVDVGLGYKNDLAYPHAKAYLSEHGVPADIVSRVLSNNGAVRGRAHGPPAACAQLPPHRAPPS